MSETSRGAQYNKEKSRRGYATVKAIDPHDGKEWDLLLADSKIDWTARQGRGAALELADSVRWSLLNAGQVFRGVRDIDREIEEDDWLCYVAAPGHAYDWKRGTRGAAWKGEVFLIYVTNERVVYLWYWDKCEEDDRSLPRDWANRFGEKVF